MAEADGYEIPESMAWIGVGFSDCEHPLEAREATVEGYASCANCGAMLMPKDQAEAGIEAALEEAQVRYRIEGHAVGVKLAGEWDDLETAVRCSIEIHKLGGYAAVFKVTTEKV